MKCPYCKENVSAARSLDFTCKFCRKMIYVRVNPSTQVVDYLTREESIKYDALMESLYRDKQWKTKPGAE